MKCQNAQSSKPWVRKTSKGPQSSIEKLLCTTTGDFVSSTCLTARIIVSMTMACSSLVCKRSRCRFNLRTPGMPSPPRPMACAWCGAIVSLSAANGCSVHRNTRCRVWPSCPPCWRRPAQLHYGSRFRLNEKHYSNCGTSARRKSAYWLPIGCQQLKRKQRVAFLSIKALILM